MNVCSASFCNSGNFIGRTIAIISNPFLNNAERLKKKHVMTQGKIDLRNESGRPMKVKVVGEVSEK